MPKRPYVVGTPTCPITEEECCYGGTEILATLTGALLETYRARLRLLSTTGNLTVFFGKTEYTCGEETVCKWYIATLYPFEWSGSMDIYKEYTLSQNWTCNACFICPSDVSESETDCTDCDVVDCPPFASASLGSGTVYFFRLNLYDSEPTGSQTINGTPNCSAGAPCFVDSGLYGYVDEFCLSSLCVEILPPTIETETWSITYEGPRCVTKFGIECTNDEFAPCLGLTQGCAERVCSDLTVNFSCENPIDPIVPDPATCVCIIPTTLGSCAYCDVDDFTDLTRDNAKRCGQEGQPPGTTYYCHGAECCWDSTCTNLDGQVCGSCHDRFSGAIGANSDRTITVDNGTYTMEELCIPAEIITVVLS